MLQAAGNLGHLDALFWFAMEVLPFTQAPEPLAIWVTLTESNAKPWPSQGSYIVVIKGAPERILQVCNTTANFDARLRFLVARYKC